MIRTYKYGICPPTLNANLVRDQIRRGHTYQNKLIEIECWRRAERRQVEASVGNMPQLAANYASAEAVLMALDKKIKQDNAKLGYSLVKQGKKPEKTKISAEHKSAIVVAKKAKKEAANHLKEARMALRNDPGIQTALKNIHKEETIKQRDLRKSDIAPWYGTYMLIEDALGKTRKMPLYDGVKPNDPRFRRFDGSGRVGIKQFQPNEPISNVVDTTPISNLVQIVPAPPPPPRRDGSPRKVGNKDLRVLRLRIGSTKQRQLDALKIETAKQEGKVAQPIWAEFPMVYHRPLPAYSQIAMVQVSCNKIAHRERWTVSITFNDQQTATHTTNTSAVGIDLGYRTMPNGMRVAKWHGSDGDIGEILLPQNLINRLAKVEQITSGRDKDFDRLKALFVSWLSNSTIPDWLQDETKTLDKWKSQGRMVALLRRWKDRRFVGDENIWTWLEYWRYHDFHLWEYERSLDTKCRGHRNEIYRIKAAKLAEQYGTIVFEDINLANLAKGKVAGGNRQLAAPSEFRNACKNATRSRSKNYEEVSARNTSKECAICGKLNDIGSKLEYFCEGCGVELDRDENAAENILNRWLYREQAGDVATDGGARVVEISSENKYLHGLLLATSSVDEAVCPARKEALANQDVSI